MAGLGTTVALIKSMGKPDPTVIEQSVSDWLDDHPEATTTVQDGSITKAKLDTNLQETVDDVSDLKNDFEALADATTDRTETTTRTDFTPTWVDGICLLDGTTSSSSSYAYTTVTDIEVREGDVITCGDNRDSSKASMRYVTCYNGSTVVADAGAENTTEFTVPSGVTKVVVTAGTSAKTNSYYVKRYRTKVTYTMKDNLAKYEAEEMHGWED